MGVSLTGGAKFTGGAKIGESSSTPVELSKFIIGAWG